MLSSPGTTPTATPPTVTTPTASVRKWPRAPRAAGARRPRWPRRPPRHSWRRWRRPTPRVCYLPAAPVRCVSHVPPPQRKPRLSRPRGAIAGGARATHAAARAQRPHAAAVAARAARLPAGRSPPTPQRRSRRSHRSVPPAARVTSAAVSAGAAQWPVASALMPAPAAKSASRKCMCAGRVHASRQEGCMALWPADLLALARPLVREVQVPQQYGRCGRAGLAGASGRPKLGHACRRGRARRAQQAQVQSGTSAACRTSSARARRGGGGRGAAEAAAARRFIFRAALQLTPGISWSLSADLRR